MSRIGKHPVVVPSGVQATIEGQQITVKGKLGQLALKVIEDIGVKLDGGRITVAPRNETKRARVMWGTTRTLIDNMVTGVEKGFTKTLEINGVGYRAAVEGSDLVLALGYSHPVRYPIPAGIAIKCEKPTTIAVTGFDKQQVGQVAAEIRAFRKPEPFKGKGIKYDYEKIRRKEGKKK